MNISNKYSNLTQLSMDRTFINYMIV